MPFESSAATLFRTATSSSVRRPPSAMLIPPPFSPKPPVTTRDRRWITLVPVTVRVVPVRPPSSVAVGLPFSVRFLGITKVPSHVPLTRITVPGEALSILVWSDPVAQLTATVSAPARGPFTEHAAANTVTIVTSRPERMPAPSSPSGGIYRLPRIGGRDTARSAGGAWQEADILAR